MAKDLFVLKKTNEHISLCSLGDLRRVFLPVICGALIREDIAFDTFDAYSFIKPMCRCIETMGSTTSVSTKKSKFDVERLAILQ